MSIDFNSVQFKKAVLPISFTSLGITVELDPIINSLVFVSMTALQLFRLSYRGFPSSTLMDVSPTNGLSLSDIDSTLLGITTDVNPVPTKALVPILLTLSGIEMDFKPKQSVNASDAIVVTPLGIMVLAQPNSNVFVFVSIMALQFSRLSYLGFLSSTIIDFKFIFHRSQKMEYKAPSPNFVTLRGITREVRFPQPLKQNNSIRVSLCDNVTD